MAFTVSFESLVRLTREMVKSFVEWRTYQARMENDPVNRSYGLSRRSEEAGRCTAYMEAFSLITGIRTEEIDRALKDTVPDKVGYEDLTKYAYGVLYVFKLIDD